MGSSIYKFSEYELGVFLCNVGCVCVDRNVAANTLIVMFSIKLCSGRTSGRWFASFANLSCRFWDQWWHFYFDLDSNARVHVR